MNICKTCNCDITKYKLKRIGKSSRFWWFYLLMILMIGTGWLLLALVIYFCMSRKYCPICKNVFYKKKKEIINEKNIKNDNEYLNNDFWNYHDNLFESILEKRGNIDNFFYDTKIKHL